MEYYRLLTENGSELMYGTIEQIEDKISEIKAIIERKKELEDETTPSLFGEE